MYHSEKLQEPIDLVPLGPKETQLAASLYSRLIQVTTGEALQLVEMQDRDCNGIEAWRLLCQRYDPHTDARLTRMILTIVNHKIRGKDVQTGLVHWEQMLLSLEQDHGESFSPKVRRALLMNVLPSWLYNKILEHLDRLKTYGEVREKIVSLCHSCAEGAELNLVDQP